MRKSNYLICPKCGCGWRSGEILPGYWKKIGSRCRDYSICDGKLEKSRKLTHFEQERADLYRLEMERLVDERVAKMSLATS